ncbi:signal peptidase I [Spirochaeta africana]|uniref:signal peptidase I n=1 Tax=Spirochaeta africana TaxID=46355 RepID=UPI001FE1ED49|nr:signal peptidase I [Spirochaeta africana]
MASIFKVSGSSMEPIISHNSRVWIRVSAYDIRVPGTDLRLIPLRDPAAGDIVLLSHPRTGEAILKQVVGTPLQHLDLQNGSGQIGSYRFDLPNSSTLRLYSRVPPGYYMVLGTNQAASQDSRHFGFVPREAIRGKVLGIRHNGR